MTKKESMIAEFIKVVAGQEVKVEFIQGMIVLEKDELWHIYIDENRFILIGTADYNELDNVLKIRAIKSGILNIYNKVKDYETVSED